MKFDNNLSVKLITYFNGYNLTPSEKEKVKPL